MFREEVPVPVPEVMVAECITEVAVAQVQQVPREIPRIMAIQPEAGCRPLSASPSIKNYPCYANTQRMAVSYCFTTVSLVPVGERNLTWEVLGIVRMVRCDASRVVVGAARGSAASDLPRAASGGSGSAGCRPAHRGAGSPRRLHRQANPTCVGLKSILQELRSIDEVTPLTAHFTQGMKQRTKIVLSSWRHSDCYWNLKSYLEISFLFWLSLSLRLPNGRTLDG
eukprot:5953432-Amphidinium_carterae.1